MSTLAIERFTDRQDGEARKGERATVVSLPESHKLLLDLLAKQSGMTGADYASEKLSVLIVEAFDSTSAMSLGELAVALKAGRKFEWRWVGRRFVLAEVTKQVQ